MIGLKRTFQRKFAAMLVSGGMMFSFGGLFLEGCWSEPAYLTASNGLDAALDSFAYTSSPGNTGYGDAGYYDAGYYGADVGDNWSHSGYGGHVGGDGETFYFIDGDSSYISGP